MQLINVFSTLFTLRCAILHWFTQFTFTIIPSWHLVHEAQTISWSIKGESCLCYILYNNHVSSTIITNVYSVLCDMRVHMNDVIVDWRVRWAPFNGGVDRVNDVDIFRWRKATCDRPLCITVGGLWNTEKNHVYSISGEGNCTIYLASKTNGN